MCALTLNVELHCQGDIFRSEINRKPKVVLEPFLLHNTFKTLLFIVTDKNSLFILTVLRESPLLSALPSLCNLSLTVSLWGRTISCAGERNTGNPALRSYKAKPNWICLDLNFLFLNIALVFNVSTCKVVRKCEVHCLKW